MESGSSFDSSSSSGSGSPALSSSEESVSDIDFLKGLIQPDATFEHPYIILESDVVSRADNILSHASEFDALKRAFDSAFRAPEVEKRAAEDEDMLADVGDIIHDGDKGLNTSYQVSNVGHSGGGRTLSVVDLLGCKEEELLRGGELLQGSVLLSGAAPADETWSMATLLLLGLVEFLCGAALSILAPFYTSEATDHGLSVTMSSAVFAAVFILQIVFTPIFGRFIGSIGSVNLLVAGSICSGLANIGFGFVPAIQSAEWFFGISLLMRAITALGESAINTSVYPLARGMAPAKYSSTVMSCIETSFGLGTMTGPFFGGVLFNIGGFYLPFLVVGITLMVGGIAAGALVQYKKSILAAVQGVEGDIDITLVKQRLKFRKVIQRPGVIITSFIVILTGMSTQWYQPTMEPYLSSTYDVTSFTASMFLVIDGAVYALISPVCGVLLDKRMNKRFLLVFGCSVISASFVVLGPVYVPIQPSLTQVGIAMGVHGVGMAANFIGSLTLLTQEIEKEKVGDQEQIQGLATSIWITSEAIGSFLGSYLGGFTYDTNGWEFSCLLIALLQLAGALLCLVYSCVEKVGLKREPDPEKVSLLDDKCAVRYGSNNNNRTNNNNNNNLHVVV